MKRLSVDAECKSNYTCPSVWLDDQPGFLIIVGHPAADVAVPTGTLAVRIKRDIIAGSGFSPVGSGYLDDTTRDVVVVVGEPVPAEAVRLPDGRSGVGAGELAVRVRHPLVTDVNREVVTCSGRR